MRRTQIQLDEEIYEALRRLAFMRRRSLSAIVRELLREALGLSSRNLGDFTFIGAFSSGKKEAISERHDEILGEGRW